MNAVEMEQAITDLAEQPFLVPLFVVNEAVERIRDGSITDYVYDPKAARLMKASRK